MAKIRLDQASQGIVTGIPTSGNYLIPWNVLSIGTGTPTAGTAYFHQVRVNPGMNIQSLAVSQVAAQTGGTPTVTLGLYPDNGEGAPLLSSLMYSGGISADITASSGYRYYTISAFIPTGLFWTAFLQTNSTSVTTAATWSCNANSVALWASTPKDVTRAFSVPSVTSLPTSGTIVPVITTVAPVVSLRRA